MPSLCHPYPNFYDIFEAGLVKDSVTGEGDICDISDDAAEVYVRSLQFVSLTDSSS